jgi:hypothetical protein
MAINLNESEISEVRVDSSRSSNLNSVPKTTTAPVIHSQES